MKPKKLNIHEMWELHTLLRYEETNKPYLVDIVLDIMKGMKQEDFVSSLKILYKHPNLNNGTRSANMFLVGLKKNDFISFEDFVNSVAKR